MKVAKVEILAGMTALCFLVLIVLAVLDSEDARNLRGQFNVPRNQCTALFLKSGNVQSRIRGLVGRREYRSKIRLLFEGDE